MSPEFITIGMFFGLMIGLFMGHPLAFVLGGLAVIFGFFGWGPSSFYMFLNQTWGIMDNYILVCIPLFIFMAQLLDQSGVAEELFDTMRYLFGPVRGGMAVAVVVVATLFGACTGIIGASVVTMGLLSMPVMLKYNYNKRLASGAVCAGGTLGILIPPSIMLVVMADQAASSVGKLFAGAVIPGLILSGLYITYILIRCWLKPADGPAISKEERQSVSNLQLTKMVLKSMVPPVILVLGVLGSIFAGIATPTEAAGVGATIAFIMTLAYGKFTWSGLKTAVVNTAKTTSMVIIILVGAACFSSIFMGTGGGEVVQDFIVGIGFGKWGTFIIMMVILFFLGMFIDWIGILMIVVPIFSPMLLSLGFDPLWVGLVVCTSLQISFLTPPFAYSIFYLKGINVGLDLPEMYRGVVPFVGLQIIVVVLIIIFPDLCLWLPRILSR
jgi:tripartite ATP-independent transporter DctM subunit